MTVNDELLNQLCREVRSFVKRLEVADLVRDDIISDVLFLVSERLELIETLDPQFAVRWVRGVAFFVARNTKRKEFRRTAAWRRLRDAFEHEEVNLRFGGETTDELFGPLIRALSVLRDLDREILVGKVWDGYSCEELAQRHGLSSPAIRTRLNRSRNAVRNEVLSEEPRLLGKIPEV